MEIVVKKFFDFAPKELLRLLAGGAILGLVLLLFMKVVDNRFDLAPHHLDLLGFLATPILGMLLCIDITPARKQVLNMVAASMVIFAVGFVSNQAVADLKNSLTPPPLPTADDVLK